MSVIKTGSIQKISSNINQIKWYTADEDLYTRVIHDPNDLTEFIAECKALGWKNNESLEAMKFHSPDVIFFGTFLNEKLIACSGVQELRPNAFRVCFRAAQLPEYNKLYKTASRYHFNSMPFYQHILPAVDILGVNNNDFLISTNINIDNSGHMARTHRAMQLMAKQGLVEHMSNEILFYTEQSIWKIDLQKYIVVQSNAKMERK